MQPARESDPAYLPGNEDRLLEAKLTAAVREAAASVSSACLVTCSPTGDLHVPICTPRTEPAPLALAGEAAESGEVRHANGCIAVPVRAGHELRGILIMERRCGTAGLSLAISLAQAHAGQLEHIFEASIDRVRLLRDIATSLLHQLALHDQATVRHSRIVARMCRHLGAVLGLNAADLFDLEIAGLLHDVGKAAVPRGILAKRAGLDGTEWAIVRQHPAHSEHIIEHIGGLAHLVPIVRHHHERWDGDGYPDRLSGESTPSLARILAMADAYEAMRAGRPYQLPRSHADIMGELQHQSGRQFDPALLPYAPSLATVDWRL